MTPELKWTIVNEFRIQQCHSFSKVIVLFKQTNVCAVSNFSIERGFRSEGQNFPQAESADEQDSLEF